MPVTFGTSNSQVISCDWYGLSCLCDPAYNGQELRLPDGLHAVEEGRTAVFAHRWYILDDNGIKLATILTKPHSSELDPRCTIVEVANYFLYSELFHRVLDICLDTLNLVPTGLSRVDLCCDFEMNPQRWEVIRMLEAGEAYMKGLRRGVVWWCKDGPLKYPHQLSWGGKESTFKWKVYYKYKELHEGGVESLKPYIEETWKSAGMTPKAVWRCEVSISQSNSLRDIDHGGRVWYREWYDNRRELFESIYSDKFVIRKGEGHKDRRNDPRLLFLDIQGEKRLKHALDKTREVESDVERRIVCKLWKEFTDREVRCNRFALEGLRQHLVYMFQSARNVQSVSRRFNISEPEIIELLTFDSDLQM